MHWISLSLFVRANTYTRAHPLCLSVWAAAVVCTNNVVAGYFFDATAVTLSGTNATTTTCPPGTAGFATRACLWAGPNSQFGVWADPTSFCVGAWHRPL
jgi:hypothetical protein